MVKILVNNLKFILIVMFGILILGIVDVKAQIVTVLQVIDGDTCQLEDGRYIRYLEINAPEKGDPQFEEATLANNKLVGGKEIQLEIGSPQRDKNNRLLVYVFVNDIFVNEELVRQGYAHISRPLGTKYRDLLLNAQDEARTAGRGIWAKATGRNIAISVVHADAEGDDMKNLNDEFIVIENWGNTSIDCTGWTVLDEFNHRYLFPNFILSAEAKVILRTGLGKNTNSELFWGRRNPIWNNDGDTIFIKDAEGNLILSNIY